MTSRWIAPLLLLAAVSHGWAGLAPAPGGVGIPIQPHGFPAYYQDTTGLALEPCLPPPAGRATRQDLCLFDPVNPVDPGSVALGVGSESFWWMAEAQAPLLPGVTQGKTLLVLALEGAFAAEVPRDGQQMTFGRVRIRVSVPEDGAYRVIHPFGTHDFESVTAADGINFTEDGGAINVLDPRAGFEGALGSALGPFLIWPDHEATETLQVKNAAGEVVEQYVGDPNIPHVVTGGPNGNVFAVQKKNPDGTFTTLSETDLFTVMGKVYDGVLGDEHLFPTAPEAKLFAVGPVNREGDPGPATPQQPEGIRTGQEFLGYPKGFPLWYQEKGTVEAPDGGLKLTLCPAVDPMCISAPIDEADANSVALRTGEEAFWWTAEAQAPLLPGVTKGKSLLVLALEAAFAVGPPKEGEQMGFGRVRVRVDVPVDGTYTITHPYGTEVLENVTAADGINMTRDVMMVDLADPDAAFSGALYSDLGPTFLRWDTYPVGDLPEAPLVRQGVQYLGDPLIEHAVIGSPTGNNFFRIQGPEGSGIDVRTDLFTVTGKVYDPATFETVVDPNAPIAKADAVTLDLAAPPSPPIGVLDNDTFLPPAAITILPAGEAFGPAAGAVVAVNGTTVDYTPPPGFSGVDTFAYQIADARGTSGNAIVTVTVLPASSVTVGRARLDLRRLQWEIRGEGTSEGAVLTLCPGPTACAPDAAIGTATVTGGRWSFRGVALADPNVTSISIVPSVGNPVLNQPLQVR